MFEEILPKGAIDTIPPMKTPGTGQLPREFCVYDTETRETEWHEIPHKSVEEVFNLSGDTVNEEINEKLNEFIDSLNTEQSYTFSFRENLNLFMKENEVDDDVKSVISDFMEE